ncbi:MAG TPA: Flp pilus assembly protein CpaB [Fimbriiglobus sp.]|jgi:Flp pilus assembly protein CpaB|nr:Flp pilus assembly protein CpaB [Fimbriiglobus sp.]
MKQKNLILVAVAVGCGLVAAFLTSQIGAKSAQVEQVEIPVAAKELPVGTKLSKEQIDTFVTFRKFSKDSVPASYASTKEEMLDKRLVRTIRAGDPFNPQDLTLNAPITPPAGYNMMTFHATPEKGVAGFAGPGSRVDILCSIKARKTGKVEVFPVLLDMLVLAIDANVQGVQQGAFQNMSMVSLAVNSQQAKLLHAAINRGSDLRLILRNTDKPSEWHNVPTEEQIWAILRDEDDGTDAKAGTGKVLVRLPVPVEDLAAGTELTAEVIEKKFKLIEINPPAPIQFALDLKEHSGRYLLKDLAADQFVPRSALGEKNQQPKPGPDLSQAPTEKSQPNDPAKPVAPKVEEKKPVYWDATVQTARGLTKYRYQVVDGDYRYIGEVKEDGSVSKPAKSPNQVTPQAEPAPETKPEGGRTL